MNIVNMEEEVNNTGFRTFMKEALQMFYGEGNALNMFVMQQGHTWFMWDEKHYKKSPQGTFK